MSAPKGPAWRQGPSGNKNPYPSNDLAPTTALGGRLRGRSNRKALLVVYPGTTAASALCLQLATRLGYSAAGWCETLEDLRSLATIPDLVLIANKLPDGFGRTEGIRIARRRWPDVVIGVLAEVRSKWVWEVSMAWGAAFCEEIRAMDVDDVVRRISWHLSGPALYSEVAERAAGAWFSEPFEAAGRIRARMSPESYAVLERTWPIPVDPKRIARALGISPQTVERHLRWLREQLAVASNDQIYETAWDLGLIKEE